MALLCLSEDHRGAMVPTRANGLVVPMRSQTPRLAVLNSVVQGTPTKNGADDRRRRVKEQASIQLVLRRQYSRYGVEQALPPASVGAHSRLRLRRIVVTMPWRTGRTGCPTIPHAPELRLHIGARGLAQCAWHRANNVAPHPHECTQRKSGHSRGRR